MKYFILDRVEDESGISGVGTIAEGIVWSDGTVAYRWLTDVATTIIADNIEDVEFLHGHDGKTKIIYLHYYPDFIRKSVKK